MYIFHKSPHQFHNLLLNGLRNILLWQFQLIKSIRTQIQFILMRMNLNLPIYTRSIKKTSKYSNFISIYFENEI